MSGIFQRLLIQTRFECFPAILFFTATVSLKCISARTAHIKYIHFDAFGTIPWDHTKYALKKVTIREILPRQILGSLCLKKGCRRPFLYLFPYDIFFFILLFFALFFPSLMGLPRAIFSSGISTGYIPACHTPRNKRCCPMVTFCLSSGVGGTGDFPNRATRSKFPQESRASLNFHEPR